MSEQTNTQPGQQPEPPSATEEESALERYDRLSATFAATVAAVPADAWDRPSPCEGWSARDVLQHVIDATTWQASQVDLDLPKDSAADDPVVAWDTTRRAVLEVLADPSRGGREYDGMFGTTTLAETYKSFYAFDLVIHRWDIAHATGVDDTIPVADVALVQQMADGMGDMIRMEGVTKAAVDVPDDADAQTRLLGYLGRQA